ncbi:hypothetical protein QVD99_003837 [Batrachochytrium dendrobatidis]|nr:hypothetical protein QVD99_003837 [Batrachochytrium dendrobatidis]
MIQHVQAWVNFESKIKHHGQEANPYPALEHIRNNIRTLTDEQFQLGTWIIRRDGHTTMSLAGPYSAFMLGISFQVRGGQAIAGQKTQQLSSMTVVVKY